MKHKENVKFFYSILQEILPLIYKTVASNII